MKIVKISQSKVTEFLLLLFWFGFLLLPSRSAAVACSADVFNTGTGLMEAGPLSSIQAAVNDSHATPGRVIRVSGTCNERVTIAATKSRITLDGQGGSNGGGGAEIVGTDSTRYTVAILGASTVTIRGFASIRGGGGGISLRRGASATIVNNTIESTGGDGVFVGERSSARIGFVNGNDTVASPNTIRSNLTGSGIAVTQRSEAWIVGNTIQDNGLDGVQVTAVSQANIAANLIDHNSRDGVSVSINSSVGLGDTTEGENLFNQANDTTAGGAYLNNNFGVRCSVNSTVVSKLGTLNGNSGRMQLDGSCPSTADISDTGFAGGTTSGSIADTGGWTVNVVELPSPRRIQISISGTGTAPATFDMCPVTGAERVFLDQPGETSEINCVDTITGTKAGSHVFAALANPQIEIRKPAADAAGVVVSMFQGNGVTIGSPVVPDPTNTQPIGVELVDVNDVVFAVLGLQKDQTVDVEPNESTGKSDLAVLSSGSTGSIAVELVDTNDATIASLALGANVAVAMQPGASDTSNVTVLSGTVPMQLAGQSAQATLTVGDSVNVQSDTTSGVSNLQVVGGSVTVVVDGQPVIVNSGETFNKPAKAWIGLKNSDDVGIRFDLRAELYKDATLVGSGEAKSLAGGSSGFNNAKFDTIPLNLSTPVDFLSGSALSITLYVRNACTGSGKNSGTARLWYNDAAANSQFGATIGQVSDFYLRDGFVLTNGPGAGPKKTIDVAAGAKCSPFKPFGTWSVSITP